MPGLLAQAQLLDQCSVTLSVLALQVGQQALALVDHLQQTAAAMVVLGVGLEVRGQLVDAGGQQGDLDFRRAGVVGTAGVGGDDAGLVDVSHGHGDFLVGVEDPPTRRPTGDAVAVSVVDLRTRVKPTRAVLVPENLGRTLNFQSLRIIDPNRGAGDPPPGPDAPGHARRSTSAASPPPRARRPRPAPTPDPPLAPGAWPGPSSRARPRRGRRRTCRPVAD